MLEKIFESPLESKIRPTLKEVNPEYSLERLMLKLKEAPVLWPPDAKSGLIGKDLDVGKDWRQMEKGVAEDEIVR